MKSLILPPEKILSERIVRENGFGLEGVTINISSGEKGVTDAKGYYSISLPSGENSLTPTKSTYFFTPPHREISFPGSMEFNFAGYHCIAPSGLNV